MSVEPGSVARFAGLLADPTRMAMCLALIDGRAWTAGELASNAGVTASTASEHLTALVAADILSETRQGRHRYLRLAGPEVGQLVEDMAGLAGVPLPEPQSLRTSRVAAEMAFAPTCYDHLAIAHGVAVRARLEDVGYVATASGFALTADGERWIKGFGLDRDLSQTNRPVIRVCLDWTERLPHLGGLAGALVREHCAAQGWITHRPRERAVRVTPAGEQGLYDELGLDVSTLRRVRRRRLLA